MKKLHRSKSKPLTYKKLFTKCCVPECPNYIDVVHHILPLSKKGKDTYVNFICLCHNHHRKYKLHSKCIEKQTELLTYKFYQELSILGFTSDIPEKEFLSKIARREAENKEMTPNTKVEEKPLSVEIAIVKPLNYGHKERTPRQYKQWFCQQCGKEIDTDYKRKFCDSNCRHVYFEEHKWSQWIEDIYDKRTGTITIRQEQKFIEFMRERNYQFTTINKEYGSELTVKQKEMK